MKNFVKKFVAAIIKTVAEKLELPNEDVMDYFHMVIWDEYLASGKAKEIIRDYLPKAIAPDTAIPAVMDLVGVTDYSVRLGNKIIVGSGQEPPLEPCSVHITQGTTRIDYSFAIGMRHHIKEVVIPESVTNIRVDAFSNLGIQQIEFPTTITVIPPMVCSLCYDLQSVRLPKGLTKIGYGAFDFCKSLEDINIPESVNVIEDFAFRGCKSLPEATRQRILEIGGPKAFGDAPEGI